MGTSYVEKKTDLMHQLLWSNFLKIWVETALWTIPVVGPFLKIPFVDAIIMALIENYLEKPLFKIMVRWGVFTSIDWQEDGIYRAYEKQAETLLPLQEKSEWDPADREKFRNAARALIHFNLRS
jgi:hypothetical protein